jgi:hypothetical protein
VLSDAAQLGKAERAAVEDEGLGGHRLKIG